VLAGHRVPITARPGWRPFTQHPSLPGHPSRAQLQHYRISILATELDAHPELANTPSGIVDLRSGTVKPHDADLLLTRITAHGVDLQAPHPRWDAFLAETFQKDGKPLVADEGPAIFGWAVRGAVEVLANGLNDPET
jgi:phage/plasmid-associated DNA primase